MRLGQNMFRLDTGPKTLAAEPKVLTIRPKVLASGPKILAPEPKVLGPEAKDLAISAKRNTFRPKRNTFRPKRIVPEAKSTAFWQLFYGVGGVTGVDRGKNCFISATFSVKPGSLAPFLYWA